MEFKCIICNDKTAIPFGENLIKCNGCEQTYRRVVVPAFCIELTEHQKDLLEYDNNIVGNDAEVSVSPSVSPSASDGIWTGTIFSESVSWIKQFKQWIKIKHYLWKHKL